MWLAPRQAGPRDTCPRGEQANVGRVAIHAGKNAHIVVSSTWRRTRTFSVPAHQHSPEAADAPAGELKRPNKRNAAPAVGVITNPVHNRYPTALEDGSLAVAARNAAPAAVAAQQPSSTPGLEPAGPPETPAFRFWHDEKRLKGTGDTSLVQQALLAAGAMY